MNRLTFSAVFGICVFLSAGWAQEPAAPVAGGEAKPVRLTAEMRQKLTECRQQVAADAQYVALLKAAKQAQARADDYYMTKLQEAVAADEKLARYVANLIREQKAARAGADGTTAAP